LTGADGITRGAWASRLVQSLYGDALRELLAPGEQVLVFTRVQEPINSSSSGFRRAMDPGGSVDPRSQPWILGFSLLNGGVQWNLARHNLWRAGTSGTGGQGSVAVGLWAVLDPSARSIDGPLVPGRERLQPARLVALTDRRIILLGSQGSGGKVQVRVEVPRSQMRDAHRRPRGFHMFSRGRVEVAFTDGSMKALCLGFIRTGRARAFVQALSTPPASS
jgi:hypothetical protein